MKKRFAALRYLLILLPLGLFIRFVDLKVFEGFLGQNEQTEHFMYIGGLLLMVGFLIAVILYIDKNSNNTNG